LRRMQNCEININARACLKRRIGLPLIIGPIQDFLMKTELISRMEDLLTKDAGEVAADVRNLQKEYQKLWTAEFEAAKQAFINEGGRSRDFEYAKHPDDIRFEELVEQYNRHKKDSDVKLAAEQARNLTIRREIIAKIRDLSQVSENVGAAMRKLQELQAQWKEAGQVSSHKYKEVQAEYSKAIEDIYYNLKIFRDLQEHDLKKNFELKTALIEKLRGVQALDNIKEAERLIKVYRNEWEEVGPVPNSKWEELKHQYKEVLDETYAKIKAFYRSVEEQKESNLQAKEQIIQKAKELVAGLHEAKPASWNEATEKLLALQAEWKKVGKTTEKDNEKVWSEFRTVCDEFFEKKKEFFSGLNEKFADNRKFKHDLISKAEALQNSTDWQKTGLDLIRLQDEWKKHPSHGDKEEPRLFQRFRKACNTFFDARKKHFEGIDASHVDNLKVREEIIERVKNYTLSEDQQANRDALKAFTEEWNRAGHVPMKDKKRIHEAFYNRLDELYDQLHIDKNEKALIQFRNKVERMAASDNAFDLLRKEAEHLKRICDEVTGRIRTYDNNLGFFKTSKGSSGFMKEIEDKIEAEKSKLTELNNRRKLVTDELARVREVQKQNSEVRV
jgi:hypothetical protein